MQKNLKQKSRKRSICRYLLNGMRRILLFFFVALPLMSFAQRERNYIYLLDCTKSMIGHNGCPNIWAPTKTYLKNELEKYSPGTTLHVIPFQGIVLSSFNFTAEDFNAKKWEEIEKKIDGYVQKITDTNICDAWDATDKYLDLHKDNYIILLTDGKDTHNGMAAVAKKLNEWCGKYPNTYAFYVQLTQAALDPSLAQVINICDNEFIVDVSDKIRPFGSFDKDLIICANTLNLNKIHKLVFSAAGKYTAKAVSSDPYFDVKVVGNKIEDGIVPIKFVAKHSIAHINKTLPEVYNFTFKVQSNEINIINPTLKVQMTNKPERTLEILSDETDMGKATWYDSFLFWGASDPDTLNVDLKAVFNDEAKKDGSAVQMLILDPDGGKDFQLLYNNQPVENGLIILRSSDNTPTILSIIFDTDAKVGNRYLSIKAKSKHELDKINDEPVEKYQLTLRAKYVVNWNPLKTILMWFGILTLALLLLWFLFFRPIVYPRFGSIQKTFNIPGMAPLIIRFKGARMVVLAASHPKKQSTWNRFWTGKILYKTHPAFVAPIVFKPSRGRRVLSKVQAGSYQVMPNPMPGVGAATIIDIKKNLKINVN